jgi:hypothetical protein
MLRLWVLLLKKVMLVFRAMLILDETCDFFFMSWAIVPKHNL